MEENEEIKIFFDPSALNVDWRKRKKRQIRTTSTPINLDKNIYTVQNNVNQNKHSDIKKRQEKELSNIIPKEKLVEQEIDKIRTRLDSLIRINPNNLSKQKRKILVEMIDSNINKLNVIINNNSVSDELRMYLKEIEKFRMIKMNNNIKHEPNKSKRGEEIQNKINTIKNQLKNKNLREEEINIIKNELVLLRNELTFENNKFEKGDNIKQKLARIESFLEKIQNSTISFEKTKELSRKKFLVKITKKPK